MKHYTITLEIDPDFIEEFLMDLKDSHWKEEHAIAKEQVRQQKEKVCNCNECVCHESTLMIGKNGVIVTGNKGMNK